jgi:hypothetical protein
MLMKTALKLPLGRRKKPIHVEQHTGGLHHTCHPSLSVPRSCPLLLAAASANTAEEQVRSGAAGRGTTRQAWACGVPLVAGAPHSLYSITRYHIPGYSSEKATFLICTAGGLDWACRGLDQLREPVCADLLRPAGAVDGHGYGVCGHHMVGKIS